MPIPILSDPNPDAQLDDYKPTPTEQMANVYAAFDETEEWYKMGDAVVRQAREFVKRKNALSHAYKDGHRITSDVCQKLRAEMNKAEDDLDCAIEALEKWMTEHGWEESRGCQDDQM